MALFRNLRSLFSPTVRYRFGGDWGVEVASMSAAQLYRTQPNLRAVVSFLADNAAQVPIKVHDRAGDNDRPRVTDSAAALLLQQPNPDMTPFEYKRWLYSDLLLFERHVSLVLPSADAPSGWELRPIPNSWVREYRGASPFAPESIVIGSGETAAVEVPADKFILFHGYSPTDPMRQSSRIAAISETLHEQIESNRFRRQMWRRGGRFNAYLTKPKDVQQWTHEAFERFKESWDSSWAGAEAAEGGGMPILEDGMEIRTVPFNSRDAQWADSVKLSREDCAAIFHVNPAMIWPGSGQTYASAKDNARALYNDCLAPVLMQATDRINMDLLPRVGEPDSHYVVYDITVKTQGSMEELISSLQSAVGAPFLTRNEARAILDRSAIDGGDELIVPLNVLEGGLASNHDTDPTVERYNAAPAAYMGESGRVREPKRKDEPGGGVLDDPKAPSPPASRKARGDPAEGDADAMAGVYRAFFERQAKSVLPKIAAGGDWWDEDRWNRELADDLYPVALAQSTAAGERAARKLWGDKGSYNAKRTEAFVRKMCERRAQIANAATLAQLESALGTDDGKSAPVLEKGLKDTVKGVFEYACDFRSGSGGAGFAASASGWGLLEGCRQNKQRGENVYKTWICASGTPRASHAAMNGETVQYDLTFSNGAKWPGDMTLPASEVANCCCVLDVEVRGGGTYRFDSATAGNVARAMGFGEDCDLACVYDAYRNGMETIGYDPATRWADLTKVQRGEAIAELHTRDAAWVSRGKVPNVTFENRALEAEIRGKRPHELATGTRLANNGVPPAFQVDERHYFDEAKGLWQTVGLADLANGYELKTLKNGGINSVDDYIRKAKKKEGVKAIVFDNFENENPISDDRLFEFLQSNKRFKGSLYLLTHDGKYLKAR